MIEDDILMAYADGELGPSERVRVEKAAADDPATAKRLMDHVALRTRMAQAFAGVPDQPVPARLTALASGDASATVIDLAAARAARAPKLKPSWPIGATLAACVAGAILVGAGIETLRPGPTMVTRGGLMLAAGSLDKALTNQLASDQARGGPINIGLSFRGQSGDYCRTFRVDQGQAMAGLACASPEGWLVKMAVATDAEAKGAYETAASQTPAPVMALAESLSAGPPLDAGGEAKAKMRGWRK